jgi:hypothetical protein
MYLFGPVASAQRTRCARRIALEIMTASLQTANTTRVKRGRNAKLTRHDAKNNAKITRNNAGVCRAPVESGAAYVLYLRELLPDVGSNLEKYYPVLVNSNWPSGAGQSWPQPPSEASTFWDCSGQIAHCLTFLVAHPPGRRVVPTPTSAKIVIDPLLHADDSAPGSRKTLRPQASI